METKAGEQPPSTPAPAAPITGADNQPPSAPVPGSLTSDQIANLSQEQIDAIFKGETIEVPAGEVEKKETPTSEQPATPPETPVVPPETPATPPETPPTVTPPVEPPKGEDELGAGPTRIRLSDPHDQAVAAVKKAAEARGEKMSWAQAEAQVLGDQTPVDQPPTLQETIATLEGEVEQIKAKKKTIVAEGGLLSPEYDDLTTELAEKSADLKLAQRDLASETARAEEATRTAGEKSREAKARSKAKAVKAFRDLEKPNSTLAEKVRERITAMQDPNHPDHPTLFSDNCPWTIALEVANELGIKPEAETPAATPSPSSPTVPKPALKVMTPAPVASATPASAQPKPEETKGTKEYLQAPERTLAELDEAFGAKDDKLFAATVR